MIECRYDEQGRLIRQAYFGTDGKTPCLNKDGYAFAEWKYDERNALIGRYFFDADKKPFHIFCRTNIVVANSQGWHAGVGKGDVVMRWEDWENSPGENSWETFPKVVMRYRSLPKTVVFARKGANGQWRFFKCSFAAGLIGINFGPQGLAKEEAEALLQAYAEWKRSGEKD